MPKILVATTSMVVEGVTITVGDTIAANHPLVRGREQFFAPWKPTFTYSEPAHVTPQVRTPAAPRTPASRPTPRT